MPDILAAGFRLTSHIFPQQEPLDPVPPAIPIASNSYMLNIPIEEIDAEEPVTDAVEEYEVDEDDDEASVCIIFNICYIHN